MQTDLPQQQLIITTQQIRFCRLLNPLITYSLKGFDFRRILYVPLAFLYAFYLQIEPFLPWTILRFIFSFSKNSSTKTLFIRFCSFGNLVRTLFSSGAPVDPAKEIDDYCTYIDQQYETRHPPFYRGRLSQVCWLTRSAIV